MPMYVKAGNRFLNLEQIVSVRMQEDTTICVCPANGGSALYIAKEDADELLAALNAECRLTRDLHNADFQPMEKLPNLISVEYGNARPHA